MTLDSQTIAKVLAANYAAAAALLAAAAQELTAAAAAAEAEQNNLAVGTALGAEADAQKALRLMQAASTIRSAQG